MIVPGLIVPAITIAGGGLVKEFIGAKYVTIGGSTVDFGNFDFSGPGLAVVIVIGTGGGATAINSVLVHGGGADIHDSSGGGFIGAIASRLAPQGSVNVQVGLNAAWGAVDDDILAVGVWRLRGYSSPTPVDTHLVSSAGVTSRTVSIDHPAGGAALYGLGLNNDRTPSWTDATQRARLDTAEGDWAAFADEFPTGAETPHSETVSWVSNAAAILAGASWH